MDEMQEPQRRALDHMHTAVLLVDAALRLRYLNPAAEILLAASRRRVTGTSFAELLPDAEFAESLRGALASGHPFTVRERVLHIPAGQRMTVDLTVTPLREVGAGDELLIELTQVDRQLRISREEQLLAQQSATRALVRGLAHEVKNPLGGLRGAAQLLERVLPAEDLKEYTQVIIREADRLQALVDRMLGPNSLPRKCALNIHEVLEHVRSLVAAEVPRGVAIGRDYDPSIPELYGDRDLLVQAVLNIVRNAAQAVEGEGHITLRTRTLRQYTIGHVRHKLVVRVDIIDDGPGIPADMQESIFFPMVTSRAEGTGLGLPIAQSLIGQHGGLVECRSRPGQTVFTLLLPLKPDQGVDTRTDTQPGGPA
ncbi:nitrogen regulation protein NR(II) [Ectothiorhodospiraceae bacterium 2226]|nr:nitrogen regulation protein NR(II) [Ectothiorhodospiraceae bacterium 2226]